MSPENFVYWLQGCLELTKTESLSKEQVDMIKAHIKLVLNPVVRYNYPSLYTQEFLKTPLDKMGIVVGDGDIIKYDDIPVSC